MQPKDRIKEMEKEIREREKYVPEETFEQGGTWNYTDILEAKLSSYKQALADFKEIINKLQEQGKLCCVGGSPMFPDEKACDYSFKNLMKELEE